MLKSFVYNRLKPRVYGTTPSRCREFSSNAALPPSARAPDMRRGAASAALAAHHLAGAATRCGCGYGCGCVGRGILPSRSLRDAIRRIGAERAR